ncbi:MAG: FAD/NAD(P)-binding protein [Deltaproteobacteria bacterium]|nr:FAD/NAD(P)-binding protein [Deltaproteobacteria bacterium]
MPSPGSTEHPLLVAVVGAGPSGFYAAEELLKQTGVSARVDLFDQLPTPFGLVRGGVAPDHQKIKTVTKVYDKTAARPGFRFVGNVSFGKDLSLEDLLAHYHMVLFSTGAQTDRRMGIPGEDLPGSEPATDFVAWYNGHPAYSHLTFPLNHPRVAVVGNGNVAMDVVRMLAAPLEELKKTDIADAALEALAHSKVTDIWLLGRRGPAQAAFTNPEIRELGELPGVEIHLHPEELALDPGSQEFLAAADNPVHKRNVDILNEIAAKPRTGAPRRIHIRFLVSPTAITGGSRVEGLTLEKNQLVKDGRGGLSAQGTGQTETLPVDMVFRSIGYKGIGLPGVPFDDRKGVIPNQGGRVAGTDGALPRLYTAGWIKRGPSGVIGTNKACAVETVKAMLEDLPNLPLPPGFQGTPDRLLEGLQKKGVQTVSYPEWQKLDQEETRRGAAQGRPRMKFTSVKEMLNFLGK